MLIISFTRKVSTTTFYDLKHHIRCLSIDLSKRRMLTCGADDVLKVICQEIIFKTGTTALAKCFTERFCPKFGQVFGKYDFFQNLTFRVVSELMLQQISRWVCSWVFYFCCFISLLFCFLILWFSNLNQQC